MLQKTGKLALFFCAFLFAGELRFFASVNNTQVGVNEPFTLTVTVEGENIGKVPNPQLPELPDFEVGGRSSSQSTSIQFINGKMTQQQTISYVYTIYPKEKGEFTIGSCTVEYEGETYETQAIAITVVEGSTSTPPPRAQQPGVKPSDPGIAIDENLKLVATTDRKSVYVGEQVTVEYALYNRLSLSNVNLAEIPSFSGFWVENIYEAQRLNFQRQTIQGKQYDVCVLRKAALFPVSSGTQKITPMALNVEVIQPPRDFFDVFGTTKRVRIDSDPLSITVKPLPETGKPEVFTGGVGKYTMSAALDRTTSEGAAPITFTIKISGTGNVRLIEKPRIPAIPGVKVLDPEINDNIRTTGDKIAGYKEFLYPLIPQVDGEHLIPAVEVAYFDPTDGVYHTLRSEKLTFTATQTAAAAELLQSGGLKVLGSDIRYIKPPAKRLAEQPYSAGWWLAVFYALSLLILGLALVYRQHHARLLTDRAYARKVRASGLVKKRLKEAEDYLQQKKEKDFIGALARVLNGYIGDRFNIDATGMTKEQLLTALRDRDIGQKHITTVEKMLDHCDIVRFSPGVTCENPEQLLRDVKKLLREL